MSPGIKAALANHMHGALAGLHGLVVGPDVYSVEWHRVDDMTTRVQVSQGPGGPRWFTIRLTEEVARDARRPAGHADDDAAGGHTSSTRKHGSCSRDAEENP